MTDFVSQKRTVLQLSSVDPTTVLCDSTHCKTRIRGNVLYSDNNHISPAAAAELVKIIEPAL
jgi:hypothetical protein